MDAHSAGQDPEEDDANLVNLYLVKPLGATGSPLSFNSKHQFTLNQPHGQDLSAEKLQKLQKNAILETNRHSGFAVHINGNLEGQHTNERMKERMGSNELLKYALSTSTGRDISPELTRAFPGQAPKKTSRKGILQRVLGQRASPDVNQFNKTYNTKDASSGLRNKSNMKLEENECPNIR